MTTTIKLGLLASALFASSAFSFPVPEIVTDPRTRFDSTNVTDFSSGGADLVGLGVTLCFFGESQCDQATWDFNTVGDDSFYGAFGTGWQISNDGDTFTSPFFLSVNPDNNRLLRSFTLYGLGANTAFDIIGPPEGTGQALNSEPESTPGSGSGRRFTPLGQNLNVASIFVTYFDEVQLNEIPYDDLFLGMTVELTMGAANGFTGELSFLADTDSVTGLRELGTTTPPGTVPLPGTLALAGLGLVGLGLSKRRRLAA